MRSTSTRGQMLGIVGETGSRKSMTAYAIAGLAPGMGARVEGSVKLEGRELNGLTDRQLRDIRGRQIAMIFQAPISSLNPVFRVGDMFRRPLRLHSAARRKPASEPRSPCDLSRCRPTSFPATRTSSRAGRLSGWRSRWPWRCAPRC